MVKLKRLRIGKYRNVKPGTELHFRDSLNVLLGRNGTGKTTLLNLIVQLLRWDFSQFQGQEVDLEYTLLSPDAEFTIQLQSEAKLTAPSATLPSAWTDFVKNMGLGLNPSPGHSLRMKLSVQSKEWGRYLLNAHGSKLVLESPTGETKEVEMDYPLLGERAASKLFNAMGRALQPESGGHAAFVLLPALIGSQLRRLDESLEYLNELILKTTVLVTPVGGNYGASCEQGAPIDLLFRVTHLMREDPSRESVSVGPAGESARFLSRAAALLGFESIHVKLQRSVLTAGPDGRAEFSNLRFDLSRRDGSVINHSLLSYGQKRLLAFYYYSASNRECVVADELVNGMHHEWIEACLEDLGDRQAFLTSQNPLLLDYLSFDAAEEVQSSFVLCGTEMDGDREQLVWRNMTPQDAEGFFQSYAVNIQHVSELLRTRGLW